MSKNHWNSLLIHIKSTYNREYKKIQFHKNSVVSQISCKGDNDAQAMGERETAKVNDNNDKMHIKSCVTATGSCFSHFRHYSFMSVECETSNQWFFCLCCCCLLWMQQHKETFQSAPKKKREKNLINSYIMLRLRLLIYSFISSRKSIAWSWTWMQEIIRNRSSPSTIIDHFSPLSQISYRPSGFSCVLRKKKKKERQKNLIISTKRKKNFCHALFWELPCAHHKSNF